jgi:hypothetical protein
VNILKISKYAGIHGGKPESNEKLLQLLRLCNEFFRREVMHGIRGVRISRAVGGNEAIAGSPGNLIKPETGLMVYIIRKSGEIVCEGHGRLEKKRKKEYAVIIMKKNMLVLKCTDTSVGNAEKGGCE